MANLIKYGNLALDNVLTLGQISNTKHSDRQIYRQTGLSSMVASFVYKTLCGLRRNNNYNNVTHSLTFFPKIFKIIARLFYFLWKNQKKSRELHVNGTVKSVFHLIPWKLKVTFLHSYITESNLHRERDYAYWDIFVVMRESTVVSFPTLSTYIVPERNNKQVSESCLITAGALGISRYDI